MEIQCLNIDFSPSNFYTIKVSFSLQFTTRGFYYYLLLKANVINYFLLKWQKFVNIGKAFFAKPIYAQFLFIFSSLHLYKIYYGSGKTRCTLY